MEQKHLIQALLNGNRKAQEDLYKEFRSLWFTICLRYCSNEADALDALQNGLIQIYSNISKFDIDKGSLKSWTCKIIVNACLMHLRQKTVFQTELAEGNAVQSEDETPIEKMSAQELVQLVQALPVGYRTVFNLYVMEGMSHDEIAEELGITKGTSKSQLFKARKLLQNQLEVMI